jgi:hypothetical protein
MVLTPFRSHKVILAAIGGGMIDFGVDEVTYRDNTLFVTGRAELGDVRVGSTFNRIVPSALGVDSPRASAVALTVQAIVAYTRYIDVLSEGMSGGLYLVGSGAHDLSPNVTLRCESS